MSNLTKLSTILSLCAAPAVFALDEYMPINARMMQIDMGFERSTISGSYGQDWNSNGKESENNPTGIPIQGKFGLLDELEGSMGIRYQVQDASGKTGMDRPVLGLKFGDAATGAGGYLSITVPVGFRDIMVSGEYATMTCGAMYDKNFTYLNLYSNISYSFNTEDADKTKIDNLRLFVKPEYMIHAPWLQAHKQNVGVSLAMTYDVYFNHMVTGESVDAGAELFQVGPGLMWTFNKLISLELNAPFTIFGENQYEMQTFRAQLYFNLDESLYNGL